MPKISQLPAATSVNLTDLTTVSQEIGGGLYASRKATVEQIIDLISAGSITVTTSTTLTNPCPSLIFCSFTTPGQTLTLPSAAGANGHRAGKPIFIKIAPTNTQSFTIRRADGDDFIVNAGQFANSDLMLVYTTNANENGIPISIFSFASNDFARLSENLAGLANAALARGNLGLGTLATQAANNVAITGGNISGIADLAVPDGGTGASSFTANTLLQGNGTSALVASNTIDASFTVSANAAITRTFNLINNANLAGAFAQFLTVVGGATAGDPIHSFSVSGVTNLSYGLDNSDGDAFVWSPSLSLGTNNRLRLSTDGEFQYPTQPAFYARRNTTATNVTGAGATYTVIFDTEETDRNADYNPATGVLTSTLALMWTFSVVLTFTGLAAANTSCSINLVTTTRSIQLFTGNIGALRDPANNLVMAWGGITVPMVATNTASVQVTINGGGGNTVSVLGSAGPNTFFSGYALG